MTDLRRPAAASRPDSSQSTALLDAMAASPVWDNVTRSNSHEASLWLRNEIHAIAQRMTRNELESCPHLSGRASSIVALWAPGLVLCPACTHLLAVAEPANHTCDRCRAHDDVLQLHAAAASPLLIVAMGLCTRCHRKEVAP